jgi:guanosine-3',5'-bis(diphosphate) 3'-pyrophosphohydrolase
MDHHEKRHTLDGLLEKARTNRPDVDLSLIENAWAYAQKAHDGQVRESGEPYFDHPVAVAFILADMNLDPNTIAAGLLHDVIEDTGKSYGEISEAFGPEIAALVDGVTKLSRMDFKSREEQQAESLRKMFVAMAKDIRVILIKLAEPVQCGRQNAETQKTQLPSEARNYHFWHEPCLKHQQYQWKFRRQSRHRIPWACPS